jgi:predicted nuclease of restriction endonuclease-like (RecB) superfamily
VSKPAIPPLVTADADTLYVQILGVLTQARTHAKRSVNQTMVQAYWQVGRLIVENEQAGNARATYGSKTLQTLAQRLSVEFGEGFSVQSLRNFRQFFLTFTEDQIRSTAWSELGWSHFKLLMRVTDPVARQWYAREAVSQTWSVAALDRQISWYEKDLEHGLLDQLQKFLLELGKGFAFVARQRHPRPRPA